MRCEILKREAPVAVAHLLVLNQGSTMVLLPVEPGLIPWLLNHSSGQYWGTPPRAQTQNNLLMKSSAPCPATFALLSYYL